MAKKLLNRIGIKTRKQKIEAEKKRQQRLEAQEAANANRKWQETSTGDEKFLAGRTNVGDFKSLKAKTGVKDSKYGTQKYKSGDEFYDTKDTSDSMSKMEQRVANRQLAKEGRKNRRAEKVAVRKGMSNQQAKDFMQNRRDRFKQMGTNFVKGLAGLPMDTKVDKRLMRKGGSGTLQNTIGKDGKVYDATSPYKGSAAKGFSDRGGSRNEVDEYMDTLQPKRNEPVPIKPVIVPEDKKKKIETEKDKGTPPPHIEATITPDPPKIDGGDIMTDQINATLADGTVVGDEQMETRLKNNQMMNRSTFNDSDNKAFDWGNIASRTGTGILNSGINVGRMMPGIGSGMGMAVALKNKLSSLFDEAKKKNIGKGNPGGE